MGNKSHIIDFSARTFIDNQPKRFGQLSYAAEEALSIYLRELNARLKDMLSNADDHLFDKSGKSEDSRHFVAMRTLRVKKDGLIKSFEQGIIEHFRENIGKFDDSEFQSNSNVEEISFENLTLVDEDDLEERIAIDSMTGRARKDNKLALENLRLRLEALLPTKTISEETNPFEPSFICSAFSSALVPVQLGMEFKLVLYKYFERNIIEKLDIIYDDVNQHFIDQGILPELKSKPVKREARTTKTSQTEKADEQTSSDELKNDNSELLELLGELLAERRGNSANRVVQQVNTDELVGLLSTIQVSQPDDSLSEESVADVREKIVSHLPPSIGGQVTNGALGQFNDDMIDVVTMLFDFILDDENLQSEIKAIIARLQIPILKVGLIDKTFFSNRKHSARLLLNELAHSGLSWDPSDSGSEPMLNMIKSTVEKICCEFTDDAQIFSVLLEDFLLFKQEHSKRSNIFEKRTREAEEGKARAEGARARVNMEIKKICYKKHVPEVVRQLLKNVWVHVMFLELLKSDSGEWENACKLAKILVWSVQPINEEERLEKLIKIVPVLIKNLKLGFNKISFSHMESSGLLDRLEDTHREIIKNARDYIEEANKDIVIHLKPVSPFGEIESEATEIDPVEKFENAEIEEVEIEEVAFSAEEVGQVEKPATGISIPITENTLNIVNNLRAGSWFELKIDDEFKRCKLAARIASSGKFIFVNRSGVKVAEYLTDALALEYELENIRLLDDEALFDRALESVISNLRTMKSQT